MDFVFRTPKKLHFSSLYRYYFDFILRLLYRVILFEGIPETVDETFFKLILYTQGKITFFDGQKIVMTNGFIKKTQKTPQAELDKALKYKSDYERRMNNG